MKLKAQLGSESHEIDIEHQEAGLYQVAINEEAPILADIKRAESDVWSLIIDGQSYEATVQEVKGKLRVSLQGATWDIEILDPRRRRSKKSGAGVIEGKQVITSPMPGRIVKVEVAVGDKVETGQGIVVVEAMKMENELAAEGPGVVKEIKCEAGQAVEDGQVLIVIE